MDAVVDTNVFVYRAIKNSEYHEESRNLLKSVPKWIVPTIVIHEVVWVLQELLGREKALTYVKALISHRKTEIISVTKQDISNALRRIEDENISLLRYNDKLIISITKRINAALLSFDKQLLTQATKQGIPIINPYKC
ncbi:PIN domain nuclease [Candidatus Woesearchaeota archaeon]|nr:MAG: PIN domain nuclease [Candidatus Woesearchaeota archaeon]